jgi:probable phosphoglycerate mutase
LVKPILTLIRHGETAWSRSGQHTSVTDLDLTTRGEAQAVQLGVALSGVRFDLVLSSPRRRAARTAELAGLLPFVVDEDLVEWDYGELEGQTSAGIQERYPGWTIWAGPWPGGETPADVQARADRILARILDWAASQPQGSRASLRAALVGHGHFSRVLAARWIGQEVDAGAWLTLDTATWSELGWYRLSRVLQRWNVPAGGPP